MYNHEYSSKNASEIIDDKELDEIINQFGSFLSMVHDKPMSCVTFFLVLQKNEELREILLDISDTSWYSLVEYLGYRFPILNKSKKIK